MCYYNPNIHTQQHNILDMLEYGINLIITIIMIIIIITITTIIITIIYII